MLVPALTVVENVVAGLRGDRSPWLRLEPARERIRALGREHGLTVDPDAPVWQLSVGEQQRVEIIKALFRDAQVLIMDEPTAVLTPQETRQLFGILRSLAAEGRAIVFISHKLEEVMAVSDRVTVMRQGKVVATVPTSRTDPRELARLMVGREVLLRVRRERQEPGPVVLEAQDIHALGDDLLPAVRGVSLRLRAGEILGIAGVDGNGQVELAEVICGLRTPTAGRVLLEGRDVTRHSPRQAIRCGIAHIPSDREKYGTVGDFSVQHNLILDCYCEPPFARGLVLQHRVIAEHARRLVTEYDIRVADITTPASLLSGGNLQKVIIARQLSRQPRVLVAVHPTRGLDVGAIEYVHQRLLEERKKGAAILLVSTELEDILTLSDRIAVMCEGRITGILPGGEVDMEELGLLMAGSKRQAEVEA